MKIVVLVFLLLGINARSSTLCLNYFSNVPVFDAQVSIFTQLDKLTETINKRPSGAMLGGDSSRLTKFIMDNVRKALDKTYRDVYEMKDLSQVFKVRDTIVAISGTLNAAYKNASAADLEVLQAYRDSMLKVDRQERVRLAEEILNETLPDQIITYFEFISETTGRSFIRVVEKYYQLRYQFKLLEVRQPDVAMMAILTNFAVQTQSPSRVARVYATSEFKVLQKYSHVSEGLKLTLIFGYMAQYLNFHVEKTYDFYFQLRNGISQNQGPILMLPGPQ